MTVIIGTLLPCFPLFAGDGGSADSSLSIPLVEGPFKPTAESLKQYQTPDWFRDAKFGIWAHWGPQSVPRAGDWYAPGTSQYDHHVKHYGHPTKHGYKDIIPLFRGC